MKRLLFPVLIIPFLLVGCGNPQETIRRRAQELIRHLAQENYDACVKLSDPRFVAQKGIEGTRLRFQILGAIFVKFGKLTEADVRIDNVTVNGDRATVQLSIQRQGAWRPQNAQQWVKVSGEWYLAL